MIVITVTDIVRLIFLAIYIISSLVVIIKIWVNGGFK